ncbi:MAG TPA: alpha-1,4-glucan--maltose-1-phosphate maltosyltransferase [Candidatus Limnocylindria bacterium]|nr:alpha-1,4-glucan--maltose-1-phosphate maltosyltransferase [Candidatus Limnocylindria bacterium]
MRESRRRVAIEGVRPEIDAGEHPIKRTVGDRVTVEFDAFADGHDRVAAVLVHKHECDVAWSETRAEALGNDRWRASFAVDRLGTYHYTVAAWVDAYATWAAELQKRVEAGQDVALELDEGAILVGEAAKRAKAADAAALRSLGRRLRDGDAAAAAEATALMDRHAARRDPTRYARVLEVAVERERAAASAWYKVFPRSVFAGPTAAGEAGVRQGTLADVRERVLPHAAGLGFDVLYLLPIHPIGRTFRKGRDNALAAGPDDPGSPYAIGSEEGGHCAVAPALGTVDDVRALAAACRERGMDLALDIAFQCSPDHPWVREHPEWFRHRPDGTIRYAENPPKKYQDIYPLDMTGAAWRELWGALRDVFLFWAAQGVRAFRVDNPHTKPFGFWRWCLAEVKRVYPDAIFLAEAFTRPKVMARLAKAGFSQSYTYFTWRTEKWELERYLTELTATELAEFMRPNFWPNTPDILPFHLQEGGRPAFLSRATLASTLAASWGVYAPAFELLENAPLAPGREEYRSSEKYELRRWDLDDPKSIAPFLASLNRIRQVHPALRRDRPLTFHRVDNDQLIVYSKRRDGDTVLVVVSLDWRWPQSGWTDLDLAALGIEEGGRFTVRDELTGKTYPWSGGRNFVRLEPDLPAHIFAIEDQQ